MSHDVWLVASKYTEINSLKYWNEPSFIEVIKKTLACPFWRKLHDVSNEDLKALLEEPRLRGIIRL